MSTTYEFGAVPAVTVVVVSKIEAVVAVAATVVVMVVVVIAVNLDLKEWGGAATDANTSIASITFLKESISGLSLMINVSKFGNLGTI